MRVVLVYVDIHVCVCMYGCVYVCMYDCVASEIPTVGFLAETVFSKVRHRQSCCAAKQGGADTHAESEVPYVCSMYVEMYGCMSMHVWVCVCTCVCM